MTETVATIEEKILAEAEGLNSSTKIYLTDKRIIFSQKKQGIGYWIAAVSGVGAYQCIMRGEPLIALGFISAGIFIYFTYFAFFKGKKLRDVVISNLSLVICIFGFIGGITGLIISIVILVVVGVLYYLIFFSKQVTQHLKKTIPSKEIDTNVISNNHIDNMLKSNKNISYRYEDIEKIIFTSIKYSTNYELAIQLTGKKSGKTLIKRDQKDIIMAIINTFIPNKIESRI